MCVFFLIWLFCFLLQNIAMWSQTSSHSFTFMGESCLEFPRRSYTILLILKKFFYIFLHFINHYLHQCLRGQLVLERLEMRKQPPPPPPHTHLSLAMFHLLLVLPGSILLFMSIFLYNIFVLYDLLYRLRSLAAAFLLKEGRIQLSHTLFPLQVLPGRSRVITG